MTTRPPTRGRSVQPILTREHAINYALACARYPRNRRSYGGGASRVYYVLECHPLPCTGRAPTEYMIVTWLGSDDDKDCLGYASTKDGAWHERKKTNAV